ncbi:MAG: adenosylmethionine decarboxylase [bacterium]
MSHRKLKLQGFNNLTKTLSFNIYDINYATNENQQREYIAYIDETYDARRLTEILSEVAHIIGASILNIAHQDYDPQGASVTMLISEEPTGVDVIASESFGEETPGPLRAPLRPPPVSESVVAHLDKSHITVHTYPESHPDNGISTFRADIDVSTCGRVSPLKALNFLIHSFDSDIVILDYRIRGFTRDIRGTKFFLDHDLTSIQNFLTEDVRDRYDRVDVNVYQENIFHTKMRVKDFRLDNYLFGMGSEELSPRDAAQVRERLQHEMDEIFYGRNMRKGKPVR